MADTASMPSHDAAAAARYPDAFAAVEAGDAARALDLVEETVDAAGLRIAGRALLAMGDRAGARRTLEAALVAAAADPIAAALAHERLAIVARTTGELDAAAGHLDLALDLTPAPDRARLHRDAAALAHRRGDLARAETHARQLLHPAVGSPAAQPGSGAAAPHDATAAREGERDDAAVIASDRLLLGTVLSERGQHAEAIEHLRAAATALTELHGAAHFDVAAAQSELAAALHAAGLLDEAATTHRAILAQRRAALGPTHPWLAVTCLALSDIAGAQDDAEAAREYAAEAVQILESRVPADDPQLAQARAAAAR